MQIRERGIANSFKQLDPGRNIAMTTHWYTFYGKPLKQALFAEQRNLHRIESYYSCIRVQPVSRRARKVKPYFPLEWMPGAAETVSFRGIPADAPDNEIAAVQLCVDQINSAEGEVLNGLRMGNSVNI